MAARAAVGVESTVLDLTGARRACCAPAACRSRSSERRSGPIARGRADGDAPRSPGMLASHYAPTLPLRLDATSVAPDEALLAFGPGAPAGAARTLSLSASGDLVEAAANLFAALRALDRPRYRRHRGDADPRARASAAPSTTGLRRGRGGALSKAREDAATA